MAQEAQKRRDQSCLILSHRAAVGESAPARYRSFDPWPIAADW